jgi:excisionase family DNA binding protein
VGAHVVQRHSQLPCELSRADECKRRWGGRADDLDHGVDDDDPWLTVAEIADELRVNPATVRLWISKGTLPAKRAGQRKLLVRQSDLDRMLDGIRREQAPVGPRPPRSSHPRYRDRPPVLQSMRQLSTADIHGHRISRFEMDEIVEQLQRADAEWDAAQAASDNPPPDPGFRHRVRALAVAAERRARALGVAASVSGFSWQPQSDQRDLFISYELRPGANRPGPPKLWEEFDRAVERLGIAGEGWIMHAVALAYRDLAAIMHEIADLLLGETPETRGQDDDEG